MDARSLSVLFMVSVFALPLATAADRAAVESPAVPKRSLLSEFVDPELKFAEGCGCYMQRSGAARDDGLVFFGKLGDSKESGWIALDGTLMELLKAKPHSMRTENGKTVRAQSYRSAAVTVHVELIQQQVNEAEETAAYTGEVTVSSGERTETVLVTGTCGC